MYSLFCNDIPHSDYVARCHETLDSLINLNLVYGVVPCFVLGIDIRPEIKISAWFFTCDYFTYINTNGCSFLVVAKAHIKGYFH